MKTSILTILIVLSSFALKAEQLPSPEILASKEVKELNQILKFTPEQTNKVTQIYVDQFKTRDSLFGAITVKNRNQQARDAALTSAYNKQVLDTDKKIISVLDSEQRARYAKYISARRPGFIMSVESPSPRR